MGEMNFSGQIQFFFLNNFILSLKIVNILQMNNDDEKNQIDLLKLKNRKIEWCFLEILGLKIALLALKVRFRQSWD